jgi:hypothetical protein
MNEVKTWILFGIEFYYGVLSSVAILWTLLQSYHCCRNWIKEPTAIRFVGVPWFLLLYPWRSSILDIPSKSPKLNKITKLCELHIWQMELLRHLRTLQELNGIAVSAFRRAIVEVKQRWSVIGLRASEGTLSRWSRLHLQSLAHTNPHWPRVVGYGPFSLYVIQKEGLCPSSWDINRLMMMMRTLGRYFFFCPVHARLTSGLSSMSSGNYWLTRLTAAAVWFLSQSC